MISRRLFLGILPFALSVPAIADDHPSVVFMRKVGDELLHAHRQGTVSAFLRVIQRYADVDEIASISLGDYKVPAGGETQYKRGVATFMSRYMAEQSRNYPIAKFDIGDATIDKDKNVLVDSKIYLMAGQVYSVKWKLNWIGGTYKVADASFLGFSMINQERNLFTSYISKHNGDVTALITALNR